MRHRVQREVGMDGHEDGHDGHGKAAARGEVTQLLERARRGERRAFDELVRRYRQRIFALALHMTGSAAEADDITQEAFIRAYQNIQGFEGRSQFFTWV